ncbi:MAG TPA: aldehyde dehydrogenase family protein [Bryobacteraceae bacterium]|nr:aldehyde dehydrogenase family protein [Bryobacteraceae bacterium]
MAVSTKLPQNAVMDDAQQAQVRWAALPVRARLGAIRRFRNLTASSAERFAEAAGRNAGETLIAEVLPLLEACRFLEDEAENILASRKPGSVGRPLWLSGVDLEIRREPLGMVLVIGPSNYPLLLAAVQVVQALTAGNAVVLKPGRAALPVCRLLVETLYRSGLDPALLRVTGESTDEVYAAIDSGRIDKVFLTGGEGAGRAVGKRLAELGIPSVMELSGEDAVFVLPSADLDRVVKALRFGMQFNGGETCIAPKHVLAWNDIAGALERRMQAAGIALPLTPVHSTEQAIREASTSGYALGAAVFGSERQAMEIASRIRAGVVVINDMIVPTADPRLPFGGRGRSGFGTTRGAEGLLEMTAVKAVTIRRGRWLPHLDRPADPGLFGKYIRMAHGGSLADRIRGLWHSSAGKESKQ